MRIRNGLELVALTRGARDRARVLLTLAAFAVARLVRPRTVPFVATTRIAGLTLTLDWAGAEHVPLREIVVRGEYWLDSGWPPHPGEVVVDCGANAGVFTALAGRLVGPGGRVVAIEPNPAVLGRLRRNVRQNGLTERVVVAPVAVGEREALGSLSGDHNTTTAAVTQAGAADAMADSIPIRRLDDLLAELDCGTVDMLKVDVEGSELPAIRGASQTLRRTRRAVIEVNRPEDLERLEAAFRDAGLSAIERRPAGPDSGATVVFASRPGT